MGCPTTWTSDLAHERIKLEMGTSIWASKGKDDKKKFEQEITSHEIVVL
jgi:hypothetical protein